MLAGQRQEVETDIGVLGALITREGSNAKDLLP